jgi:hypothetical protein
LKLSGANCFHRGIEGAAAFQQHLVLIIGLLGGMFAARDRRLLSLSTLTTFLKGRWHTFARVFSSAFATGITIFLCLAAIQLVQSEKEGGKLLAYGIPVWTVQLIMPIGFAVIALRLFGMRMTIGGAPHCLCAGRLFGLDCVSSTLRAGKASGARTYCADHCRGAGSSDFRDARWGGFDLVLGGRIAHCVDLVDPLFHGD